MTLVTRIRLSIALVPGALWLKRRLFGTRRPAPAQVPIGRPGNRGTPPSVSLAELGSRYRDSPMCSVADTFVLYRIIGNDLPPRHAVGQSRRNVGFILENEPQLPACEKRFVVNRIVDPREESAVLRLLDQSGFSYLHIPFDRAEYGRTSWDIEGVPAEYAPWTQRFAALSAGEQGHVLMRLYRHKNNYVMNNNGARNAALRDGRSIAKWVLPWDGNCFVTASAWNEIVATVCATPELPYFVVPMARITDEGCLLDSDFRPDTREEPQLIFRRDATTEFDPDYYYGRRPKVEMLWRLGVPGGWDDWPLYPWDLACPHYAAEGRAHGYAGWVARLSSGQTHLEETRGDRDPGSGASVTFIDRGFARVEAIKQLLDDLDDSISLVDREQPAFVRGSKVSPSYSASAALMDRLRAAADEALSRGPYSVVDKRTLPPSGNRHDYWHPAPYYWPHPLRLPGLPYVRRDGRRVPGTLLYEPLSENYDRTRLQRLFDDTFVLTLAWHLHGDRTYAEHAAMLVRTWFLASETAMNPHLDYAQVRRGHNRNRGNSAGIIEMKDVYYFLDAVRLLEGAGWLSKIESTDLQAWFDRYLHWLQASPQGREERAASNNHGTYYDLQVAAIAAFLGDTRVVRETLRDSRSRILQQIDATGFQGHEMNRTNTAHYCCFSMQGWTNLAQLADACGEDLWSFQGSDGRGIQRAMQWLLRHFGRPWPYAQQGEFDRERFLPVYHTYVAHYGELSDVHEAIIPSASNIKPLFFPHDGIMPFWQLSVAEKFGAPAKNSCTHG